MRSVLSLSETTCPTNLKEKYLFEAPEDIYPYGNVTSRFAQFLRILFYPVSLKVFFIYVLPSAHF